MIPDESVEVREAKEEEIRARVSGAQKASAEFFVEPWVFPALGSLGGDTFRVAGRSGASSGARCRGNRSRLDAWGNTRRPLWLFWQGKWWLRPKCWDTLFPDKHISVVYHVLLDAFVTEWQNDTECYCYSYCTLHLYYLPASPGRHWRWHISVSLTALM